MAQFYVMNYPLEQTGPMTWERDPDAEPPVPWWVPVAVSQTGAATCCIWEMGVTLHGIGWKSPCLQVIEIRLGELHQGVAEALRALAHFDNLLNSVGQLQAWGQVTLAIGTLMEEFAMERDDQLDAILRGLQEQRPALQAVAARLQGEIQDLATIRLQILHANSENPSLSTQGGV
jgi:hypothetical protein